MHALNMYICIVLHIELAIKCASDKDPGEMATKICNQQQQQNIKKNVKSTQTNYAHFIIGINKVLNSVECSDKNTT